MEELVREKIREASTKIEEIQVTINVVYLSNKNLMVYVFENGFEIQLEICKEKIDSFQIIET